MNGPEVDPGRGYDATVRGVFAAMTIPRQQSDGRIDSQQFSRHLQTLHQAGLRGFVLNGATGEFCLTTTAELGEMIAAARAIVGGDSRLVAAIGGASVMQVLERLKIAQAAGADVLLLPMPYFFPYEQQDLVAFVEAVSSQAALPLLLYNLPAFTTPLEPATTLKLLQRGATRAGGLTGGLSGIKDSSGSLETMRLLTQDLPTANRVIGNDGALYAALADRLCDGVVSGVACVLPELMLALYAATTDDAHSELALGLKIALDEFLEWLGRFPVPWGLKIIAEERGFSRLDLPIPLSPQRALDRGLFVEWFRAHRDVLLVAERPMDAVRL